MKTADLFLAYAQEPERKFRSNQYRTLGGCLFMKQEDQWKLVIFRSSTVCIIPHSPMGYLPTRGKGNQRAFVQMCDLFQGEYTQNPDKVCIRSDRPLGAALSGNLRQLTYSTKVDLIKRGVKTLIRPPSQVDQNISDPDKWEALIWEFVQTNTAYHIMKSRQTMEAALNTVCVSPLVEKLPELLGRLRENIQQEDYSAGRSVLLLLAEKSLAFGEALRNARAEMEAADRHLDHIRIPTFHMIRYQNGKPENERFLQEVLQSHNNCGTAWIPTDGKLVMQKWLVFMSFMQNIGLPIPKPFGLEMNQENLNKLAALRDTSVSSIQHPESFFTTPNGETETETETTTTNLYLG